MTEKQENCRCLHGKEFHDATLGTCAQCGCLGFKSILCHHRTLRRKCDICDLEDQVTELESKLAKATESLKQLATGFDIDKADRKELETEIITRIFYANTALKKIGE